MIFDKISSDTNIKCEHGQSAQALSKFVLSFAVGLVEPVNHAINVRVEVEPAKSSEPADETPGRHEGPAVCHLFDELDSWMMRSRFKNPGWAIYWSATLHHWRTLNRVFNITCYFGEHSRIKTKRILLQILRPIWEDQINRPQYDDFPTSNDAGEGCIHLTKVTIREGNVDLLLEALVGNR